MIKEYLGNDIYKIQFSSGEEVIFSLENIKELISNCNNFVPSDEVLLFDENKHIEKEFAPDFMYENLDYTLLTFEETSEILENLDNIKRVTKSDKIELLVDKIIHELS